MDLLTLAIEAIFGLVFVVALVGWWKRRDALSRDVVLVFAALAGVLLLGLARLVFGPLPALISMVAAAAVLAQPVVTLRLAADIRPVPRLVLLGAAAGWALTTLPFVFLGRSTPVPMIVAAVGVFILVEVVAAGYLAAAARRRAGAASIRLWIAAGATGVFAVAIFAAGAGSAASVGADAVRIVGQVLLLVAALGYLAAFAPPGILRRLLQAHTAYAGLRRLLAESDEAPADVWQRFLALAIGATGAAGGYVVADGASGDREIVSASGLGSDLAGHSVVDAPVPHRGNEGRDGALADLATVEGMDLAEPAARAIEARYGRVIRLGTDGSAPTLVLFSTHRSLFGDEDRALLTALGQQASGIVANLRAVQVQRDLSLRLGETVSALRAASQAKSDFLASMSHELRTPLNAIIGFSDLMRREPVDEDGNVLVPLEWVEHVRQGGTHLVELVNDVLDLSKVEAGRLELDREPVEVQLAVSESVAGLRPLADRKSHSIEVAVDGGEFVAADRGRLRQVLYNLLSNAIKFTPEGGRIRIEGESHGDDYHLSVVDSGVGIAIEDQAAVFEEFRQVGDGVQRSEGTGLGLALSRRLVEAHEGRIELQSTPGSGSRFTVVLPACERDALPDRDRPAGAALALPGIPRQASVLVVEDDPSAVRLLHAYLEPEGYAIRVAADGEEALREIRADRPAAILLDVLLPGIDGWEVLRRLKADPELRDIPVVIVTVVDEKDVGLALGAVDYLVKPINRDALLTSLGRLALSPKAKARSVRILAVDDEPSALDMLSETLRPAGFDVVRAATGVSAIQIARAERPDLVICDLVMPDLDGFGVVAALKADPETAEIPIIILTGHDLTAADKERLNGKVIRIVSKGLEAQAGLRAWLVRSAPLTHPT